MPAIARAFSAHLCMADLLFIRDALGPALKLSSQSQWLLRSQVPVYQLT